MRNTKIKEMAKDLEGYSIDTTIDCEHVAEVLYDKDYRKASDVARVIFNDIENALYSSYYCAETEDSILTFTLNKLNEAKHKHLDANFFVKMTGFSEPPIPHTIESIADLAFQESENKE